jgi:hypothetical protein
MNKTMNAVFANVGILMAACFIISDSHAQQTEASQRVKQQDAILGGLQAANNAAVSEFVKDWRKAYPEPSKEELAELRKIYTRIKKNKSAAIKMTQAYKVETIRVCRDTAEAGLPLTMPECQPGL